jgi:hypothetical protein
MSTAVPGRPVPTTRVRALAAASAFVALGSVVVTIAVTSGGDDGAAGAPVSAGKVQPAPANDVHAHPKER